MPIGIAIAATAISGVASFLGSKKASKAAKRQAEEEAKLEKKLTGERVRQLDIQERVQYGETLAGYAGGGVRAQTPGLDPAKYRSGQSGSPLVVLQEAAREFARERQFTEEVGASNVAQINLRGKAVADQYKYKGYADLFGGVADIFKLGAEL